MLIPSNRHTVADLRLWSELEASDWARSKPTAMMDKSIKSIREFWAKGPCYAGVSMGKESVLLAYLVHLSGVEIPLVWIRYGMATNPDCFSVRDALLPMLPGITYHEIDVGESEVMRDDFTPAAKATGTTRYLSGLRADESGTRAMSIRYLGLSTENTCRPLGWWKIADVFSALCHFNLPVNSAYAMLGGGRWPREHLRVASIGGRRATNMGRAEWEREYYGDVLNRIASAK